MRKRARKRQRRGERGGMGRGREGEREGFIIKKNEARITYYYFFSQFNVTFYLSKFCHVLFINLFYKLFYIIFYKFIL